MSSVSMREHWVSATFCRSAYERLKPDKFAPVRLSPGQSVKLVGVGFDTMVQPSMTVSAYAVVAEIPIVANVARTTAVANPAVIRRRGRAALRLYVPACDVIFR